jgi:hypothetical protein
VSVARVSDRLRHVGLADAERAARLGEARRLEDVAAVHERERGLGDLLREAQEDEEEKERGHQEGIIGGSLGTG